MHTYLKDRKHYEDRYDDITIAVCRRNEKLCYDALEAAKKKLEPPKTEDEDPEFELRKAFGPHYYFRVEYFAGERWEERDAEIQRMMDEDAAKDQQIADARLASEPSCRHCGKTGLRIVSKDLMHRGKDYSYDAPQDVLITLECPYCEKRSAFWPDGTEWERLTTKCPKCRAVMDESSTVKKNKEVNTTYVCPSCKHSYIDTLDLTVTPPKEAAPDPSYEKDKARFCLSDEKGKEFLRARENLKQLKSVVEDMREREEHKDIYEAIKEIRMLKIPELSTVISTALEKAKYTEFSLGKPEIGKDVFIDFSCLDAKSDREDYASRKDLAKAINKALEETNWRLSSTAIQYRLGYLTGRLRAYEREEDLRKLVEKSRKKPKKSSVSKRDNSRSFLDNKGREIILYHLNALH